MSDGFDDTCTAYDQVIRQAFRIRRAFLDAEANAQNDEAREEVRKQTVQLQQRELEKLVLEWIAQRRRNGKSITNENAQEVARRVALLLGYEGFSSDWLEEFKTRNKLTF